MFWRFERWGRRLRFGVCHMRKDIRHGAFRWQGPQSCGQMCWCRPAYGAVEWYASTDMVSIASGIRYRRRDILAQQRPRGSGVSERARLAYRLRRMTRRVRRADIRIYASVILAALIVIFAMLITVGPASIW